MSKEKYHHLIPRTYMKSWKHGSNSVYIIKKGTPTILRQRNIDNIGGVNYYHSIVAGMINASPEECAVIFDPLKNLKIEHEGQEIKSPYYINQVFYDYDSWNIYYPNGSKVPKGKKNELKQCIKNNIILDIEKKWADNYEHSWKEIVSKLPWKLYNGKDAFKSSEINRKEFIDFIVSLDWRSENSNKYFTEVVDRYTSLLFEDHIIPQKERTLPFIKNISTEIKHGLLLNTFKGFQSGKGIMSIQANEILKKGSLHFYLAGDQTEFITGDKPVLYEKIENKIVIFFPVNPKVVCIIAKNEQPDKFYFGKLDDTYTKSFNKRLKENCNDFYILREPNINKYF